MDKGFHRRDFFKALATGGAATVAAVGCSDKPEKLIPYLIPPDNIEFIPGIPIEYATTCMECPAACGMIVRTREARAIKAEGNPDHPVNQGALCIRGQASLQTLYNPARIKSAMQRSGTDMQEMAWADAEKAVADKLKAISDKSQVVLMTSNVTGSRGAFLDSWLKAIGGSQKVVIEPLGAANLKKANAQSFQREEIPQYRIAEATYLVNFGADFLETWLSPVEQNREFGEMHSLKEGAAAKGKFVHIGPHVSITGANADQWVSIQAGTEATIALTIANIVFEKNKRKLSGPEVNRLEKYLADYTVQKAVKETGATKEAIERVAKEFQAASSSLALAGGTVLASEAGTSTQIAVNILNYVTGNIGKTVNFGAARELDASTPYGEITGTIQRMLDGKVKMLIVDGVNPLYAFPASSKIGAALDKVETIVSLSSQWDETTTKAHIVLPGLTSLERWGDASPRKGVRSLIQPVMAPVFPVKSAEDTLLAVAKAAGIAVGGVASYKEYIQSNWKNFQKETGSGGDFDAFWRQSLQKGGVFQQVSFSGSARLAPSVLDKAIGTAKLEGNGLALLPTASLRHRDGSGASHPWLQEIPDPISQVVWDSWADIHPETAEKLGIKHGEKIRVKSAYGEVETVAYLHYGVHRDAVAIPMGQGHTDSGRNADMVGVNVVSLLPSKFDAESGEFAYLSTKVEVKGTGNMAFFVQMDGSPRQDHRGIIQTMTLDQVEKKEAPHYGHQSAHDRETNFFPERADTPGYYEPYRWGMTIDSDRCTGCSACSAACYAENNIAVVGKERAALGREMSWLRVERFIEGEGDDYRTLVQPMLCQQCENAGCEPVCPVYATYHNPEGLNAQVYNRCVGTRYCSNNCAYKVRRFNWFNYEFEAPLNMQLNPDVTVRSKGVMEKCTFCLQRITAAKDKADKEGRLVRDGEITPACAQTCPTKAIVFGNLSDPNSKVAKLAMRDKGHKKDRYRQYEVLEEMNNRPSVTYLRKVVFEEISEEA